MSGFVALEVLVGHLRWCRPRSPLREAPVVGSIGTVRCGAWVNDDGAVVITGWWSSRKGDFD